MPVSLEIGGRREQVFGLRNLRSAWSAVGFARADHGRTKWHASSSKQLHLLKRVIKVLRGYALDEHARSQCCDRFDDRANVRRALQRRLLEGYECHKSLGLPIAQYLADVIGSRPIEVTQAGENKAFRFTGLPTTRCPAGKFHFLGHFFFRGASSNVAAISSSRRSAACRRTIRL
jgi:hypothetical protein